MLEPLLKFTIPGPPVGKGRPRFWGKKPTTPPKTRKYEELVGWCGRYAANKDHVGNLIGWYYLDVRLYFKNDRRPDTDNVVKAVMDGLEGVLWANDRNVLPRVQRVVIGSVEPRIEVEIYPYELIREGR
jgi:crossover junction endodeoxyribonuclease RusA